MSLDDFRNRLYIVIFHSDTPGGRRFDIILLWLILLSIAVVIMESIASVRNDYAVLITAAEWFFTISFSIEYIGRLYSSPNRYKYVLSFYGIIDLLSILPAYLGLFIPNLQYLLAIRALRLLRVFRILKLARFLKEGNILALALRASMYKITVFLTTVITLVVVVGTLMYVIEGEKHGFTSIPVSIYWAIVTITTVGYGDISPATPLGQFIASALMIIGYGIIAVPTGIVSSEITRISTTALQPCPNCKQLVYPSNAKFCSNCGFKQGENPQ
jgi:voltage-gated potassium channel